MSVVAGTEVEWDINLDAQVPCAHHDCATEATWRLVNRPCNHGVPMCAPHADAERRFYANAVDTEGTVICGVCYRDTGARVDVTREDWYPL